jgi:hypothetical protein
MKLEPGPATSIAGAIVLFVSTFLNWFERGGFGGVDLWSRDLFGFVGVLLVIAIIEVVVIASVPIISPDTALPERILGFSMPQITMSIGFMALVLGVSILFAEYSDIGPILAAVSGAAIMAGGFLDQQQKSPA